MGSCGIPRLTLWQSLLSVCVNAGSNGSLCCSRCSLSGNLCSLSVSMWEPNGSLSGSPCCLSVSMRDPTAHFVAVFGHFLAISAPPVCQCRISRLTLWQSLLTLWQSLLPVCVNAGSQGSLCGSPCSFSVSMQDPNSSLCGNLCSLCQCRILMAHFVAVSAHFLAISALSLCRCRILMAHFVAVSALFLAISAPSLCQCRILRLTLWHSLLPLCVDAGS